MRRRCAELGIRDPALQCKLFDTLVLPILSYGVEGWGVKPSFGKAAEALHRSFLKTLLEFGSPQQMRLFWQKKLAATVELSMLLGS